MKIFIRLILVFALLWSINLSAQKVTVTYSNSGNYTFTVPGGVTSVTGEAIGGGGGGGNAVANAGTYRSGAAGGGGAGGCVVSSGIAANTNYSITVGAGGGSAAAGTTTSIGSLSAAGGAAGGSVSAGSSDFLKGAGGGNCQTGEAGYNAGSTTSTGATGGLGGGSSHTRASCGNNAATGGPAGTFPGGGGGGAAAYQGALQSGTESGTGGAGARGRATITFDVPTPTLTALNNRTQYCPNYPVKLCIAGNISLSVTYQLYNGSTLVTNLDNTNSYSYETSTAGTYTVRAIYKYAYTGTAPSISTTEIYSHDTTNKTFTMQSAGISITPGSNCPPICTTGGTLLFRESFEDPNDPYSPSNPVNTYIYAGGCAWTKSYDEPNLNNWAWSVCDDHTYPNDPEKGYYLYVNIDDAATLPTVMFYQMTMPELCNDAKLTVSFWLANMVVMPEIYQPNLEINVYKEGDASKTCLITGGKYKTGKIQPGFTRNEEDRPFTIWNKYFFPITLPAGVTSVVLEITNLETNGGGNDLLFDDFEVRFCTPSVNISNPSSEIATGCGSVNLAGNYTDDGITFGNNLVARWEYSASNNISNPSLWTPVAGTQTTSSNGTISLNNTVTQSGYYRLIVSNSANINTYYCRAMSNVIYVTVHPIPAITSSETAVCNSNSILMTATPTGGTWNSSSASVVSIEGNTYLFANNTSAWQVPLTGYYYIETWGGNGGRSTFLSEGGVGDTQKAAYFFNQGESLYIQVGKKGANGSIGTNAAGGASQWFGKGGDGGKRTLMNGGGGGGSASGVLKNGTNTSNIIIAAGGGGGDGTSMAGHSGGNNESTAPSGGNNATTTNGANGVDGTLLIYAGGGGGGGFQYGGFGAPASTNNGGGGGMSYTISTSIVSGALPNNARPANNSGDGYVIITYLGTDINYVKGTLSGLTNGTANITYSANGCTTSPVTVTVQDCFIKVNPQNRVEFE